MTDLVVRENGLPVDVEGALAEWRAYQELTEKLLAPSDYQAVGKTGRFKKKSAWRKYARAFNLTDRVTAEEIVRDPDGWPRYARIRVVVTSTNGRQTECDQEAHVTERCCPAATGGNCRMRTWKSHTCCLMGCNGRAHWSHPGDIPATALTRAKNRAIADLIGAGEVSAEEMPRDDDDDHDDRIIDARPGPQNPTRAAERPVAPPPLAGMVTDPAHPWWQRWLQIAQMAGTKGLMVPNLSLPISEMDLTAAARAVQDALSGAEQTTYHPAAAEGEAVRDALAEARMTYTELLYEAREKGLVGSEFIDLSGEETLTQIVGAIDLLRDRMGSD